MSEEENTPAEEAVEEENTPEETTVVAQGLGVADLKLAASIIEVVSNRGAIKANEMAAVGTLYNKLMEILVANGAVQQDSLAVQPDAEADADAVESTDDGDGSDD